MSSVAVNHDRTAGTPTKVIRRAWLRIVHWIKAVAMIMMITSGWQIYNASPLFSFSFSSAITLGGWLGGGLLWRGVALACGVFLLDTIVALASLYALADVAFVGGSLVPRGGHNIIEPAQHGVAIIVGNHTENFRDIVSLFQSQNAVRVVGAAEFPLVLMDLLSNEDERVALGRRGAEPLRSQLGATERTLRALEQLLDAAHVGAGP